MRVTGRRLSLPCISQEPRAAVLRCVRRESGSASVSRRTEAPVTRAQGWRGGFRRYNYSVDDAWQEKHCFADQTRSPGRLATGFES